MGLPEPKSFITVEEYLIGERDIATRHEYVLGQVYAMAGASDRHNRIAGNLFSKLDSHLDDKRCEAFISDMKIRLGTDAFYYPDVMVSCDDPPEDNYYRTQPVLIIEVLSPSTQRTDQTEKLAAYRSIPTLREYAIVWQDGARVELHRQTDTGDWNYFAFTGSDAIVTFESVGLSLKLDQIYRNVRW